MRQFIRWAGVGVGASCLLAGCQSSDANRESAAGSVRFSQMDGLSASPNAGEFTETTKSTVPQVGLAVVGEFETVVGAPRSSNPAVQTVRRQVLKLKPISIPGEPVPNDYVIVLSATRTATAPNWTISSTKRLFRNGVRAEDEPAEPSVDVIDSGTVVGSGTGPIITVKKATVASEATKFAVEATPGNGWVLAVFEAASPVEVYFADSAAPVLVPTGKCLRVRETDNVIPQPITDDELYTKLHVYSQRLWAATGSTLD